jgi:hypothetical protein
MNLMLKGVFWLGLYMQIIILPLLVGALWPGEDRGLGGATRTPAEIVAARVARLTVLLSLTTPQQNQATAILTTEQTALAALTAPRDAARTALEAAIKANNSTAIATQAAALGDLEKQRVTADATADAAFYALLTAAQRTTFDNIRTGGLDRPGRR